jgi:glycosyltransferase involved in cell wall biosynthesis
VHVALITQNADLELDIRPRSEAEALAAAGRRVTLVGGTKNPARVRELTAPEVGLALYDMPEPAGGAAGQVRELSQSFRRTASTLARLARRTPIDVVHASNPPDNACLLPPLVRPFQRFTPAFVFDQHDVAPVLLEEKYGSDGALRAAAELARRLERLSFRRARLVVFANEEYDARARRGGLLRGGAVVVPNGWSLPEVETSGHWREGATHLIAYVGAIGEQDHVPHLVEAAALLPDRDEIKVCVAGDGSGLPEARTRARELAVEGEFTWLGWLYGRDDIASLVRSADVCVAPEIESDFNRLASFVKLAEYMSVGAPIAAHRLPQTERLCGDTIEYAEDMTPRALADAVTRLLDDPEHARRLGAAARERFERTVAWPSVGAPRLVEAYARVFGPVAGT